MDLRGRIPNIKALQRQLGLGSYDKLRLNLSGKRPPSVRLAKRIEAATNGAIHWDEFFKDPPDDSELPDPIHSCLPAELAS